MLCPFPTIIALVQATIKAGFAILESIKRLLSPKKLKILFIHNKYKQYGGEDAALELEASLLKEKGHHVQVLLFDNKKIEGLFSKIKIGRGAFYNINSGKKLETVIRQFKPDVIHIHNMFFIASPSLVFVAHRHKIPVILTLHNYRLICANATLLRNHEVCELCIHKKLPLEGILHKCYRNSAIESALVTLITGVHKIMNTWKDKITTYIALNDFSRFKLLNSSLQIPASKMIVKSNFVNDFGEGIHPRENFFLFAGRISKEKGVYVLAKAFADMPQHKIIILGSGPEMNALKEEYKSYANIIFKGQVDQKEVREHMKLCKALICPSIWHEGTSLTIMEAFAAGTPVIASRPTNTLVSINDGFNGFNFIPGDPCDLQKKIRLFEIEVAKSKLIYKNARQVYLECYHPDIHYNAILKIYQKAIETKLSKGINIMSGTFKFKNGIEQIMNRLINFGQKIFSKTS